MQIVMVGDFLQLPPVVQEQDRPMLDGLGYTAPYAFNAHILQALPVATVALERVWRQAEDDFIDMLGRVRSARAWRKRWRGSMRAASGRTGTALSRSC